MREVDREAARPEEEEKRPYAVGDLVWTKPPDARCDTRYQKGTVTGNVSQWAVEVDGTPRHVRDLRPRAPSVIATGRPPSPGDAELSVEPDAGRLSLASESDDRERHDNDSGDRWSSQESNGRRSMPSDSVDVDETSEALTTGNDEPLHAASPSKQGKEQPALRRSARLRKATLCRSCDQEIREGCA